MMHDVIPLPEYAQHKLRYENLPPQVLEQRLSPVEDCMQRCLGDLSMTQIASLTGLNLSDVDAWVYGGHKK